MTSRLYTSMYIQSPMWEPLTVAPGQEHWQNLMWKQKESLYYGTNFETFKHNTVYGKEVKEHIKDLHYSDIETILWCTFYHKEVLKLLWDFNKREWVEI